MRQSRLWALHAASVLCAALALSPPAAANGWLQEPGAAAPDETDPFAAARAVPDAELAQRRGGFHFRGLDFDMRILVRDSVNGREVATQVLQLVESQLPGVFGLKPTLPQTPPITIQDGAPAGGETAQPQTPVVDSLLLPPVTPVVDSALTPPAAPLGVDPNPAVPLPVTAVPQLAGNSLVFPMIVTASGVSVQRDIHLEVNLNGSHGMMSSLQQAYSVSSDALLDAQLGASQP